MPRFRVGILGCGAVAQVAHLPSLRELDDRFEIVALCDVDAGTVDAVGEVYGIGRRHCELDDLLREPLDAVLVLTSGDHHEAVLAALEAGMHVFVEKPLTYTFDATDEIVATAEARGCHVMVGMTKRYDAGYLRAAAAVAELRDLRHVDVRILHPENDLFLRHLRIRRGPEPAKASTSSPMLLGRDFDAALQGWILSAQPQGRLAELAVSDAPEHLLTAFFLLSSSIHDVNALRGVLGEPTEVIAAEAWGGGTQLTTVLAFGPAVRATYTWSFLPHLRRYVHHYTFVSSEACVHLELPSPFVGSAPTVVGLESMRGGELVCTEVTPPFESAFTRELVHFHECIAYGRRPLTDARDSRCDLEVLHAIAAAFR
jgi:predicted dehydrogenase